MGEVSKAERGPIYLLGQQRLLDQPRPWYAMAGTIAVHFAMAIFLIVMPETAFQAVRAPVIDASLEEMTPLVAPPPELASKGDGRPNAAKKEVTLEGLLSRRAPEPAPQPAPQHVPAPKPNAPEVAAARPIEAPKIPLPVVEPSSTPLPELPPGVGTPDPLPPPPIEAEEKPKIAFERPGSAYGDPSSSGVGGIKLPPISTTNSVREMGRQVPRSGGSGLVVEDFGENEAGGLSQALATAGSKTRQGSSLELMSDPMGVDFRPYLIKILSTVRRNWFAVIPETARLGRQGRVQIQFAVNRDGSVPKLVIATPSGTESLDRAAVAGISASNPFPPLPAEFKGLQVRLQFTFLYNVPTR